MQKPANVDEYIATFAPEVQNRLQEMRRIISTAVPQAQEVISYGMPAFKINSVLVYFAAWEKHIGFYPGASGIANFKDELSAFKGAKGSVQFPMDEPMPVALINKIVAFRVSEDFETAEARRLKKRKA